MPVTVPGCPTLSESGRQCAHPRHDTTGHDRTGQDRTGRHNSTSALPTITRGSVNSTRVFTTVSRANQSGRSHTSSYPPHATSETHARMRMTAPRRAFWAAAAALLAAFASADVQSDDYYQVLGIDQSATPKQIKSAYRKLALAHHPDKAKEDEKERANALFVKVSEAYSVLGDDDKKKIYDMYGKEGLKSAEQGQHPGDAGGFEGFGFDFGGGSPFDMFEQFFGGDSGGFAEGSTFYYQDEDGNIYQQGGDFDGQEQGGYFQQDQGGYYQEQGGYYQQQQELPPLFPKGYSAVKRLGKPKYPDASSKSMWLVMFYDPNEIISHQIAQEMEELAREVEAQGAYKVGAVDCTQDPEFCREKGATHLPEFAMVVDGLNAFMVPDPNRGLDAYALNDFALEQMPKIVHAIDDINQVHSELLDNPKMPAVLLISNRFGHSSLFQSLAYRYRPVRFGESLGENRVLSDKFNVEGYPNLLAFIPKGSGYGATFSKTHDIMIYSGEVTIENFSHWLQDIIGDHHTEPPSPSHSKHEEF